MLLLRIDCITKPNRASPFSRIQAVGGVHENRRWRHTLDEAVHFASTGQVQYYTHPVGGHLRYVDVIRPATGSPYLKTRGDKDLVDNLLYLPECPV